MYLRAIYGVIGFFLFSHLSVLAQDNHSDFRTNTCLNGWWDFQPVLTEAGKMHAEPGVIPKNGWLSNAILVPGSWKRAPSELRTAKNIWTKWETANSFSFPAVWDTTNTAWYRRTFQVDQIKKDKAYLLRFEGVLRESWIFVNGKEVGHRKEGSLPSEHDITAALKAGENEIVLFITDYKRDENGHTFVHVGTDQMGAIMGIWGDVYFQERPLVRVDDMTIQTSIRKNELTVIYTLINQSKKKVEVHPEFTVTEKYRTHLTFSNAPVTLNPGETKTITKITTWKGYIPWSPTNPQLYFLGIELNDKTQIVDILTERFGFREIWIDGHDFILNGKPIHLRGEWCHKDHFDFFRPEYIRQWFGMLKDMNMNYIRTHTFPHPKFVIEMADEMGILVCLESSWFMSNTQAMDKDEFWANAREHATENIYIYKNHPSIIFWSPGNEVRWGWNISAVVKHGPEIQKIYEDKDPTRLAFSDGSTSLWDERSQKIISRHYGVECTGEEFWDKSKPLHVGEFGKWHYGQPIDNLVWGNDSIFGTFEGCAIAIAKEAADVTLQARSNEVSCIFPWNISGLDNYRPVSTETKHQWSDYNAPYAKPLRTGAYASEFAWWQPNSKGYIPGAGFEIIKHANRPFAIYIREKFNQVFSDQEIIHTVSLINDLGKDVEGILKIEGFIDDKIVFSQSISKNIAESKTSREIIKIPAINVSQKSELLIKTSFSSGKTEFDCISRELWIIPAAEKTDKWNIAECLVFGDGSMRSLLESHQVNFKYIATLDAISTSKEQLLIVEKNSFITGSQQNKALQSFISKGGRVFMMEQENSAMPELKIESKPSEQSFIRAYMHPLMNQFTDSEFSYWGYDPYGKSNSDSWVTIKPFVKPTFGNTTILLDSGAGDFGSGGLLWTPLFEIHEGNGIAICSQLRLSEKMIAHPAALKMIRQTLIYLSGWSAKPETKLAISELKDQKALGNIGISWSSDVENGLFLASGNQILNTNSSAKLLAKANKGSTVILHSLDSAAIVSISNQWKLDIQPVNLGAQYNLVRESKNDVLNGISNQETYWLDKAHYTAPTNINRKITDWLFKSTKGTVLLASESQSCWREFYTQGAQAECLRMPVITHYLYNGPRENACGMMQFEVGKGKLIVCQIPLPDSGYFKSQTFWSQLLANQGVAFTKSLFEGEGVVEGMSKSKGDPNTLRVIKNPGNQLVEQIISKGNPGETSERFTNQGLEKGFEWEKVEIKNGELVLTDDCKELMIYYELNPGRPRKLTEVVGGWPDPSQQTFIDLFGKGEVTLYVNGKQYEPLMLDGGKASVSDIDLNQYWNSILIHFKPQEKTLKMHWRNRQGRPEVEFQF